MPVYEERYTTWEGHLSAPRSWRIIARTGTQLLWRRSMVILLLLAALPFVVRGIQIYVATRLADLEGLTDVTKALLIDGGFFADFLKGQRFFLLVTMVLAGSGLIANDRRFKALSLYFSKPVRMRDYLAGKFLIISFYGALVTFVPALLLFIERLVLSQDSAFFTDWWWVPLALAAQSALVLLVCGSLILALSSASGGARSAGILFFAAWMVPEIVRNILSGIEAAGLLSLPGLLDQTSALLFGLQRPFGASPWAALAILLALTVGFFLFIRVRLKATEVVG